MESYPNSTTFDDGDVVDGGADMDTRPSRRGAEEHDASRSDRAVRQKAGEVLHGVKDRAERVSDAVKQTVSSASNYVKNVQATDMWGDVKELARKNPGASLLAVAVIGFAIGRSSSRSRSS